MSRIVIDAREYTTSTGRYISNLIKYLGKMPTEYEFIILLKPDDMAVANFKNSNFKKIACPFKEFTFGEQLGFKKQLDNLKPDLIHFGKDHQPILYKGKVVTTMHDLTTARFYNPDKHWLMFKIKQLVYRWVVKKVARKSITIFTGSNYVKNDIVEYAGIDSSKVVVTYEAADPINEIAKPVDSLINKQFIMYIGRPTPHKNLEGLIKAFRVIQSSHPELMLVLAGKMDKNYSRIKESVVSDGITNILFTDYVSEAKLRWLYENCSAYIFPSFSEGFGLPGLEAMVHGAPVVSSNATCLPEIYGEAALYFDPTNIESMANVIAKVLDDKTLRQELIVKGKQQAAKYSWQRMAEQTMNEYNLILSNYEPDK